MIRTDLALEAKALWEKEAGQTTELPGVKARERLRDGLPVTEVEILDRRGEEALGKPVGRYLTLELPRVPGEIRPLAAALAEELEPLLPSRGSVLVAGLGNEAVTPDALGPRCLRNIFLTRHLIAHLPDQFGKYRPVCAVAPGVLGTTGVESMELVRGVVEHVKPACVLAVDALAAASAARLCCTVQLADTGIVPGSGVGNRRAAFNKKTLGVPVVGLGIPTVIDAATLGGEAGMIVTPRDIDARIRFLSAVVAGGINLTLHPGIPYEDFAQFVPDA